MLGRPADRTPPSLVRRKTSRRPVAHFFWAAAPLTTAGPVGWARGSSAMEPFLRPAVLKALGATSPLPLTPVALDPRCPQAAGLFISARVIGQFSALAEAPH